MQIQPAPVPLANPGSETAGTAQGISTGVKAETPRPVGEVPQDSSPRFPYPEPNRGHAIDIEV